MRFLKRLGLQHTSHDDPVLLFLVEAPQRAPMAVAFARAEDGSLFWPAFTDTEALLRFQPGGGDTASARLSAMRDVMAASGITTLIVDPGSRSERVLQMGDLPEPRDTPA